MTKSSPQPFDFEQGMARLEEIIGLFDEGGLTLDQMEQYFAEGMELIAQCSQRLDGVETRVTQLIKEQADSWKEKSFEENAE